MQGWCPGLSWGLADSVHKTMRLLTTPEVNCASLFGIVSGYVDGDSRW